MPIGTSCRSSGERNVSAYISTSGTNPTLTRIRWVEPQTRALELVACWDDEARRLLPEGATIFDAHLHLGQDIDGMVGDYDQLEELHALRHLSRLHVLPRRARPAPVLQGRERP